MRNFQLISKCNAIPPPPLLLWVFLLRSLRPRGTCALAPHCRCLADAVSLSLALLGAVCFQ